MGIYNRLYTDIISGLYDEARILPGENVLAQKYGVSRNTLRQALAILMEDGLIRRSQGRETEIVPRRSSCVVSRKANPLVTQAKEKIERIESVYNFGLPTDIAKEKLHLTDSAVVLAVDSVYFTSSGAVGYSFVQVPVNILERIGKNIRESGAVEALVSSDIFSISEHWDYMIRLVKANSTEAKFLRVDEDTDLLLFELILSDSNGSNYSVGSFDDLAPYVKVLYPETDTPYIYVRALIVFGLIEIGKVIDSGGMPKIYSLCE